MKLKTVVLSILIFIYASSALSNRHEHFTSWPTATNIISAYNETYKEQGRTFHDIDVDELFLSEKLNSSLPETATEEQKAQRQKSKNVARASVLKSVMSEDEFNKMARRYNVDTNQKHHIVMEQIGKQLEGQNIKQIATHFNKQKGEDSAKRILKFLKETPKNSQSYMKIETVRRNLFNNLKNSSDEKYKEFLTKSFSKTIRDIPFENRQFIGFSIPHELYDEDLKLVKKAFKQSGSQTHFYLSIPRTHLTNEDVDFDHQLKRIKSSIDAGWGDGVDITGSIQEGNQNRKKLSEDKQRLIQERMRERMKSLVTTLGDDKKNTVLRLHAFEATNKGGFYDEIYKMMNDVTSKGSKIKGNPPVISIGHINELTESDIQKMAKLKAQAQLNNVPFNIVFDLNYQSNVQLQDADGKKLAKTIELLRKYQLPVAFGSDGTGILGYTSSDVHQARLIAGHNVSQWTVNQMTEESRKAPVCEIPTVSRYITDFTEGVLGK